MNTEQIEEELDDRLGAMLEGYRRGPNGERQARCPFHDDQRASLSINLLKRVWICHAGGQCGSGKIDAIFEKLEGRPMNRPARKPEPRAIVDQYRYEDEEGVPLYEVVRFRPKHFAQRRRVGSNWHWNLDGIRRVPYRLPELREAVNAGRTIFVVEGEKDVESLVAIGLDATTCPGGAGKWRLEYSIHFTGANIVILPDNDKVGLKHAEQVAGELRAVVKSVRTVMLPDLPPKGDVSDWLQAGGDKASLMKLVAEAAPIAPTAPPLKENHTDLGNAKRLVHRHGRDIKFVPPLREWLVWDGRRWAKDETGEIIRRAKDTIRAMYETASALPDEQRGALAKWALQSEAGRRIAEMVTLATSENPVPIMPGQLDVDPWALNVLNGVVDLKAGRLTPHRREMLMTKLAPVAFIPDARLPLWDDFLAQIFPDPNLRTFVQRAVGYSLTGMTTEEKLFFAHGPTGTGKSTLLAAVRAVLGDYAMTTDFETFLKRGNVTGSPRSDIARLRGARLVVGSEVDEGRRLAEGMIKQITGNDTVAARFLHKEFFEFKPSCKIWLAANHRPAVSEQDDAMWRRILQIPFEQKIPEEKQNPEVKLKLQDLNLAGPAILAWAVEGALSWQEVGLGIPPAVRAATQAYREEMDPLGDFLLDACRLGAELKVPVNDLWRAYQAWLGPSRQSFGLRPRDFGVRLEARGFTSVRGAHGTRMRKGLALVNHAFLRIGLGGPGAGPAQGARGDSE